MCTLDGLNTEHKFRVWVTILGRMSLHFTSLQKCYVLLSFGVTPLNYIFLLKTMLNYIIMEDYANVSCLPLMTG